jgi:hypothetical protein
MTKIPAICLDPQCNTIFPSVLDLKAANFTVKNIGMGPCPKCRGDGKIPDGTYSVLGGNLLAILEDVNDIALFQKVAATIKKDLKRNKSPKNIKKKLTKKFPKQKSIWNLIPETKQDAYAVISIMLAIILMIIGLGKCTKDDRDIIINQSINNLYLQERPNTQPGIPYDNHTGGTVTQDKPEKI